MESRPYVLSDLDLEHLTLSVQDLTDRVRSRIDGRRIPRRDPAAIQADLEMWQARLPSAATVQDRIDALRPEVEREALAEGWVPIEKAFLAVDEGADLLTLRSLTTSSTAMIDLNGPRL